MESIFGWLGDVFRWALALIPRMLVIRPTHQAVWFIRGGHGRTRQPGGIIFYWPFWTIVEQVAVVRDTLDLPCQYLTTADSKTVSLSGLVEYKIEKPVLALTEVNEYPLIMRNLAMRVVRQVIEEEDFDSLHQNGGAVDFGEIRKFCYGESCYATMCRYNSASIE